MEVTINKRANLLEIQPALAILHLLVPELTFTKFVPKYGKDLYMTNSRMAMKEVVLYSFVEAEDRLYTFAGFVTRIATLLRNHGHTVQFKEFEKRPDFEPVLDNLSGIQLRKAQEDMLAVILSCERGQLNGLTAMGKTFLIKQICKLFPYPDCHIVICAQQRPIVDAIHRDLVEVFPGEVGMCGNGANNPQRITVTTAKSLMKCHVEKTYMLLYDEVHTAGADGTSKDLMNFMWSKMYGFSASTECRSDKADKMVEALFGPVRCKITYDQGVEEGIVPEIDTHFYKVRLDPFQHKNPVVRKRTQIWNNPIWNDAVIDVAKHWEKELEDPQILILTDTLEHVLRLWQRMKDYTIIYATFDRKKLEKFMRLKLIPYDYKVPSPREMRDLIRSFEGGGLRKVIATTTLGTGVDLRHLDVMIRADAGASEISNIQFRGRVTRGQFGVYCDFLVDGDNNEEGRSHLRLNSCKRANWKPKIEELPC